jgi:hypothetical protein
MKKCVSVGIEPLMARFEAPIGGDIQILGEELSAK